MFDKWHSLKTQIFQAHRNFIRFNHFGSLVCIAGFGTDVFPQIVWRWPFVDPGFSMLKPELEIGRWCLEGTIWLWLTVRHGKIHHAIKNGKPSISIRVIYTMANWQCHNQRLPILGDDFDVGFLRIFWFWTSVSEMLAILGKSRCSKWSWGETTTQFLGAGDWDNCGWIILRCFNSAEKKRAATRISGHTWMMFPFSRNLVGEVDFYGKKDNEKPLPQRIFFMQCIQCFTTQKGPRASFGCIDRT